jgi:hypothetical protein
MLNAWPQLTSRWPKPTLVDLRYPNGFALRAEGLRLAEEAPKAPVRPAAKPPVKPVAKPNAGPAAAKPEAKVSR